MVDRILLAALRSPTAGNTRGTAWVVLEGREQTARYWDATTDEAWRDQYPERSEGLRAGPGGAPRLHLARGLRRSLRGARQGRRPGLGAGQEAWPVPYWYGDAAFGVMTVLLGAVDAGLGACILGTFRGEAELAAAGSGSPRAGACSAPCCSAIPTGGTTARVVGPGGPTTAERIRRGRWR